MDVEARAVERESATVGVGHNVAAAVERSGPSRRRFLRCVDTPRFESLAIGVGNIGMPLATRVCRLGVPALGRVELLPFCELPYWLAVGVGSKEPPSFTAVGGAHLGSCKSRPPSVIPETGQISDNDVGVLSDAGDVFQEHVSRSKLADKADDFAVKTASLSVQAASTSCNTEILAGEAAGDDVDRDACEVRGAKSGNVVPNWCSGQSTVGHPRQEHAASVFVDLAVGDGSHPGSDGQGEVSDSREKIQTIHAPVHHSPNLKAGLR